MPYSIKNAVEVGSDLQIDVWVPNPRYRSKIDETKEHPGTWCPIVIPAGANMNADDIKAEVLKRLPPELAAIAVPGGAAGPKKRPDLEISVT